MPNQAPVQANMIVWTNAYAERRYLAVDSQTRCANPVFNFATGRQASAGQHLLEALGFIVSAVGGVTART